MRRLAMAIVLVAGGAHSQQMDMDDAASAVEIHFGGDVNAGKQFGDSATSAAFSLGVVDMMVHGRLSRQFSVLSELVYEADGDVFGFDMERLIITWQPRSWFALSAGRFHTPVGYWNTSYHHAKWMYSSIDAPLFARFEDQGGPLPTHTIGVFAHGLVPVGAVRLEYDLGVGNGRGPKQDPPQTFGDINEGKSVVGALHVTMGALRIGVSGVVDATTSAGFDIAEQVAVADAHFRTGPFEAIAEGGLVLHQIANGASATNAGGYLQLAYWLRDELHLYARAERFARAAEEVYLTTPSYSAALGGARYDFVSSAALKVEGGWQRMSGVDGGLLRAQVAWLF